MHENRRFKKLIELLQRENIVECKDCKFGKRLHLKGIHVVFELLKTSLLLHTGIYNLSENEDFLGLIIRGKVVNLNLPTDEKVLKIVYNLVGNLDIPLETRSEELFNSFLGVLLASYMCLDLIYPNTYIRELGRNTHELDLFGAVITSNEKVKYMLLETTIGSIKRTVEGELFYDRDSHNWHFKKAIMKKWAIEKIFNVKIKLFYLTVYPLQSVQEDKFVRKIMETDNSVKVINFPILYYHDKPTINAAISDNEIIESILHPIIDSMKS